MKKDEVNFDVQRNQIAELYARVTQLEKLVQYPNTYQSEMAKLAKERYTDLAAAREVHKTTVASHPSDASACDPARTMPPHMVYQPEHLYAPLRSDTRAVIDLAAFARRLIDMQDLGHAVTEEVRELAKRALGLK